MSWSAGLPWGTHATALRVTDDNPVVFGGPQTSIATCNVEIKPPPHCPHPSAGGPYLGTQCKPQQFDASKSFDPDSDPMTYEWDLDGDGIFGAADHDVFGHDGDGVGMNPFFTFPVKFTGPVAVKVTDHPDQNPNPYNAASCSEIGLHHHRGRQPRPGRRPRRALHHLPEQDDHARRHRLVRSRWRSRSPTPGTCTAPASSTTAPWPRPTSPSAPWPPAPPTASA